MNSRKSLPISLGIRDERGSVLIELVVATVIFAVVVASVAFYFVYHVGTINDGRAQLKLQRVGSLLMEEMTSALRAGKTVMQANEQPMEIGVIYNDLKVTYPVTIGKPPKCFSFDDINKDIKEGPDDSNLSPMRILDDSQTVGGDTRTHRIMCTALEFKRQGDRVIIQFRLKHDLDNGEGDDDLDISFRSTVKLRG
jgi:type II secretory pathway pseudopilin PulG